MLDLEYDPAEIPEVIAPIVAGLADVVYGSRFMVRRAARVLYYYHYLANRVLTCFSNLLTNRNMTDIETCYKAFRASVIKPFPLTSSGFGMEVEITALVCKTIARTYEIPISYYGRTYEEGKKIALKDGIHALWHLRLQSRCSPASERTSIHHSRQLCACRAQSWSRWRLQRRAADVARKSDPAIGIVRAPRTISQLNRDQSVPCAREPGLVHHRLVLEMPLSWWRLPGTKWAVVLVGIAGALLLVVGAVASPATVGRYLRPGQVLHPATGTETSSVSARDRHLRLFPRFCIQRYPHPQMEENRLRPAAPRVPARRVHRLSQRALSRQRAG